MRGASRLAQDEGEANRPLRAAVYVTIAFLVLEVGAIVFVFISAFQFQEEALKVVGALEDRDDGVPLMILLYD